MIRFLHLELDTLIHNLHCRAGALLTLVLVSPAAAANITVDGVQAAAIEMPKTTVLLRRPVANTDPSQITPLNVRVEDIFNPGTFVNEYAFEGHLDTGTSGVLISREFYEFLGVNRQVDTNGNPYSFYDVTVDGEKQFHISEQLYVSIASSPLPSEPAYNNPAAINQIFSVPTPVRAQLAVDLVSPGQIGVEPRNVIGMPVMLDKTAMIDATRYNHLTPDSEETPGLVTTIHSPGDTTLPRADHTIKLSYANLADFTRTDAGAEETTLAHNPFIGASPLDPNNPDAPPGVTVRRGNSADPNSPYQSTGNWLLDTGAQVSFMSSVQAANLNLELTDVLGFPILSDKTTGELIESLFFVPISGSDPNSLNLIPGFVLEELVLQSPEGTITYRDLPILILDVLIEDKNGNVILLDGDIGMNLFLPSMGIEGEPAVTSLFDYMVFDESAGELRLTLVPEPTSLAFVGFLAMAMMRRTRRRPCAAPRRAGAVAV